MLAPRSAPPRRGRAFTTIEILVALGLFGVVVALALPAYGAYKERVRTAQAVQDILGMQAKITLYIADNRTPPPDLAAVGLGRALDPWGRAYRYYNIETGKIGKARKNHNLVPINSDYDLYSSGPDGNSVGPLTAKPSRDDIVRANNGAFVGRASDY